MEYTGKGQGALNTVLGAIGTYGALANGSLGNFGLFNGGYSVSSNGQTTTQNILDVVDLKTENAILKSKIDVSDKIAALESKVDGIAANQAVINCGFNSAISVLQNQAAQLMDMTKLVIPNSSVCPGWGTANVSVTTGTTTA